MLPELLLKLMNRRHCGICMLGLESRSKEIQFSHACRGIVGELGGPSQDGQAALHAHRHHVCSIACGLAGWSALSKPGWYERSF